jgi:hypothetical protein
LLTAEATMCSCSAAFGDAAVIDDAKQDFGQNQSYSDRV